MRSSVSHCSNRDKNWINQWSVTLKRLLDPHGVPFWYVVRVRQQTSQEQQEGRDNNNNKKCKKDDDDKKDEKDTRLDSPDSTNDGPVVTPLQEDDEPWMIVNGKLLPPVPRFSVTS